MSRIISKAATLAVGLLLSVLPAGAENHDLEWWAWQSLKLDLSGLTGIQGNQLFLRNENRFNEDIENHSVWNWDAGLSVPLPALEGWSLMPVYRNVTRNVNSRRESHENRYYFDLSRRWRDVASSGWELAFRLRYELIDAHSRDDMIHVLRPKLTLSHALPIEWGEKAVRFYLSDEPFYDFDEDRWNRNRFGAGFKLPVHKNADLTLGYQMESDRKGKDWDDDSMIMTGLDLKF